MPTDTAGGNGTAAMKGARLARCRLHAVAMRAKVSMAQAGEGGGGSTELRR